MRPFRDVRIALLFVLLSMAIGLSACGLDRGDRSAPARYVFAESPDRAPGQVYVTSDPSSNSIDIDGSASLDGKLPPRTVRFGPAYGLLFAANDLAMLALVSVYQLVVVVLLFVIPGLGLLSLAGIAYIDRAGIGIVERISVAIGLSLAFYPVLFLWAEFLGMTRSSLWYIWLPAALGLGVLALKSRAWISNSNLGWSSFLAWRNGSNFWPDVSLLVAFAVIALTRFLAIRGLPAPLWGDSVQHAVMAQLVLDNHGLFDSWQPYAPYASLSVHFGFSALVAAYAAATHIPVVQSVLIVGQLINVFAVLATYALALRLSRGNRWAGVFAVVVAGLISPMPAFFVNWGRYAQLAGQAILPSALWLLWASVGRERLRIGMIALAAVALAGMNLTYYRMVVFYGVFVLFWLAIVVAPRYRRDARLWIQMVLGLAGVAAIAVALFFPWLPRIVGSSLAEKVTVNPVRVSALEVVIEKYQIWRSLTTYVSPTLLFLSGIAVGWGIIRRDRGLILTFAWTAGISLLTATRLIGLPGALYMENFSVLITLYIPVGVMVGMLAGWLSEVDVIRNTSWVLFIAVAGIGLITFGRQMGVVEAQYAMVTDSDTRAMAWIEQYTSPDALFLVEGASIYDGRSAVGTDAGWWIPLLANRRNTMPPQYALFNEKPIEPGYSQRVVGLVTSLEEDGINSSTSLALLCDWGVTHVFIGEGQGLVGVGLSQLFSPEELSKDSALKPVYEQGHVRIFELDPTACKSSDG